MSDEIILAPVLDLKAAAPLKEALDARRGAPLDLDASKVERVGGLCVQILIAAATAWGAAGQKLRVINASDAFRDDMRRLGAAVTLTEGGAS